MKLFVYGYREFDEKEYFDFFSEKMGVELGICADAPTLENAELAREYDYISIITSPISRALIQRFRELGIKMISTRTIGYDHIDMKAAGELNMKVSNATYSPGCVADYTVMLMLMVLRKMKRIMQRADVQDFTLKGIQGREMHNMTVGVIGTGRIGATVIRDLQGFGCKVLAYDLYKKEEVTKMAEYVELDALLENSDIISLHMPLTDENHHMINAAAIEKMKQYAIIINTARGGLIDSNALISGLECGKIGGAGLDVVEKEAGLYYYDRRADALDNRELAMLRSFPNTVVTPHMAFYSDQAISDMVYSTIFACAQDEKGEENPYLVQA